MEKIFKNIPAPSRKNPNEQSVYSVMEIGDAIEWKGKTEQKNLYNIGYLKSKLYTPRKFICGMHDGKAYIWRVK